MTIVPAGWTTWGTFPESDKEVPVHMICCHWRAFSPDQSDIISVYWLPELNPEGGFVCRHTDKKFNTIYSQFETKNISILKKRLTAMVKSIGNGKL